MSSYDGYLRPIGGGILSLPLFICQLPGLFSLELTNSKTGTYLIIFSMSIYRLTFETYRVALIKLMK